VQNAASATIDGADWRSPPSVRALTVRPFTAYTEPKYKTYNGLTADRHADRSVRQPIPQRVPLAAGLSGTYTLEDRLGSLT